MNKKSTIGLLLLLCFVGTTSVCSAQIVHQISGDYISNLSWLVLPDRIENSRNFIIEKPTAEGFHVTITIAGNEWQSARNGNTWNPIYGELGVGDGPAWKKGYAVGDAVVSWYYPGTRELGAVLDFTSGLDDIHKFQVNNANLILGLPTNVKLTDVININFIFASAFSDVIRWGIASKVAKAIIDNDHVETGIVIQTNAPPFPATWHVSALPSTEPLCQPGCVWNSQLNACDCGKCPGGCVWTEEKGCECGQQQCPNGYYYSQITAKCERDMLPPDDCSYCTYGGVYNSELGGCICNERPQQQCPDGYTYSPDTGGCVPIEVTPAEPCPSGYTYNPSAGECLRDDPPEGKEGQRCYITPSGNRCCDVDPITGEDVNCRLVGRVYL